MARARLVKPGFFANEALSEVHPYGRLLFIGLWQLADREGRLKDSARFIKAQLFPFEDKVPVDKLLSELDSLGFIMRYEVAGERFIQVSKFKKHQTPHVKEQASTIPAPDKYQTLPMQEQGQYEASTGNVPAEHPPRSPVPIPETKAEPETEPIPETKGASANAVGVVSRLYENEIGTISGLVREQILDLVDEYELGCIEGAFEIAVKANKRSLGYVQGICRRHKAQGSCIDSRPNTAVQPEAMVRVVEI